MQEKELENAKRAKLRREKPVVYDKVLKISDRYEQGIATPIIDIVYNYACNLKCQHCTAAKFTRKERRMTINDIRKFSEEADSLGLCQFCISGGEPLMFKDLDNLIMALQPDKFHLAMSTNGHFMTPEVAKHLKSLGLDKVKISLDDFDEKRHDANRNDPGAYRKAVNAMMNARDAGLSVVIQTVVTHQNCQTNRIFKMAEFAQENDFTVDILVARATGAWEGKHEVLIDESDAEFLRIAHESYPVLHRDTFPSYGMDKGCGCVDSTLHLTPYGDIMPCVYIPISLGNIFEKSLSDIIDRGQSIKWFKEYSKLCLSGEDRNFIKNYMAKTYSKPLPVSWRDVFDKDDFIK